MKINAVSAYGAYQTPSTVRVSGAKRLPGKSAEPAYKTDRISFSREAAGQKEVEDISKAVVRESAKGADPARLERLKTAVADRSYHIPNGALADAILNRAFLR